MRLGGAYARLQLVYKNMLRIGSGEAVAKTLERIGDQVQAVALAKIGEHFDTGRAESAEMTTISGSTITESNIRYLRYHRWWPFRGGKMPPFIMQRALKIFGEETVKLLTGR